MSKPFGIIPPEPGRQSSLDGCAPAFALKVKNVLAAMQTKGFDPIVFEALRSAERSVWLYGFGRDYDDGRGVVTQILPTQHSWHFFGLAADIISKSKEWNAPAAFWTALRACAEAEDLVSGQQFSRPDGPHVQWNIKGMHCSPTPAAQALYDSGGLPAVWAVLHAE